MINRLNESINILKNYNSNLNAHSNKIYAYLLLEWFKNDWRPILQVTEKPDSFRIEILLENENSPDDDYFDQLCLNNENCYGKNNESFHMHYAVLKGTFSCHSLFTGAKEAFFVTSKRLINYLFAPERLFVTLTWNLTHLPADCQFFREGLFTRNLKPANSARKTCETVGKYVKSFPAIPHPLLHTSVSRPINQDEITTIG